MRRICRKLGFVYVRGKKRHYVAESSANVAFRASYLQKKLANRRGKTGRPCNPEVFLDESYCGRILQQIRTRSYATLSIGSDQKRHWLEY
eukprot:jgi/Phyca11/127339/e_gw1.68.187.1